MSQAAQAVGRDVRDITLIAVSKTHTAQVVREAAHLGLHEFGENYVQEALDKKRDLSDQNLQWHFIGHLQSNKVKHVVGQFILIHSVDSQRVATEISKHAYQKGLVQKILLQVKIGNEQSKGGLLPNELPSFVRVIGNLPGLAIEGLMTIPAPTRDEQQARSNFRQLRELLNQIKEAMKDGESSRHSLCELSMGMSSDFDLAIEEGATLVRVGSALFGARTGANIH
jgi:pyridoxal phosphate enzyme (YggS family)